MSKEYFENAKGRIKDMIKIEYFIRCFDCGELKEAVPMTKGEITIYTCMCENCCSITRSSKPDVTRI